MIRLATTDDIDAMLTLGEAMHAESRYADLPWDAGKVRALITGLVVGPDGLALVAERDGVVVGGFIGLIFEHFFSRALIAQDFALFVSQDKRGGMVGAALLKAYIDWANKFGAVKIQVGLTTGVNVEASARLCEAVGFVSVGHLFEIQGESPCA